MDKQILFVTGMFRSGTTLIARILNAHEKIVFCSDPYFWLFKFFRNCVWSSISDTERFLDESPLQDYYYDDEALCLFEAIQDTGFSSKVPMEYLSTVRERVAKSAAPYSPKIVNYLGDLNGQNFFELFEDAIRIIEKAYGKSNATVVGFKEVWTGEFGKNLIKSFPNIKVIHVIRDPRAVCASKNVTTNPYSWLFLTRQWRKLSGLAIEQASDSICKRGTLLIKYEDLINNPNREILGICDFLNIEYKPEMSQPSFYKDGLGNNWYQNSSYSFDIKNTFNMDSIWKWREVLSPEEQFFIEKICYCDMKQSGYLPEITRDPEIDFNDISILDSLMDNYAIHTSRGIGQTSWNSIRRELSMECLRGKMLASKQSITAGMKKKLCLTVGLFENLSKQV